MSFRGTRNPSFFLSIFNMSKVTKNDQAEAMEIVQEDKESQQKSIAKETIKGTQGGL